MLNRLAAVLILALAIPVIADEKLDIDAAVRAWRSQARDVSVFGVEPTTACFAGEIACNQTRTGRVSLDSCESGGLYAVGYVFRAQASQTFTVTASSSDFAMSVFLSDGRQGSPTTILAKSEVFRVGETAQFTYKATFAGEHLILVTPGVRYQFGDYSLTVTCGSGPGPEPCTQASTSIGVMTMGQLGTNDCRYGNAYADHFTFVGVENQPVRITIEASFPPYLEASPDHGLRGQWDQSETPGRIVLTYWPTETGAQKIVVSSAIENATGSYTMLLENEPVDPCRRRAVRH